MGLLRLLIRSNTPEPDDGPTTRLGGVPLGSAGTEWPLCGYCERPMRFLGQARLQDVDACAEPGFALAFGCGREDADSECVDLDLPRNHSAVLAVASTHAPLVPPAPDLVSPVVPLRIQEAEIPTETGDQPDDEREAFAEARRHVRGLVGKLGGVPLWLSGAGDSAGAFNMVRLGISITAPYCQCQLTKRYKPKRGARPTELVMQFSGLAIAPWAECDAYLLRCPVCSVLSLELDAL